MRTVLDFSPLHRAGFVPELPQGRPQNRGPLYDIVRLSEDEFRITLAVPGFAAEELELTAKPHALTVRGIPAEAGAEADGGAVYLHRGLIRRPFEQTFRLADHVTVDGASLGDGLLAITLKRVVPEALKPRTIEVKAAEARAGESKAGESKAAA